MKPRSKEIILGGAVIATAAVVVCVSVLLIIIPLKEQIRISEIELVIQQAQTNFYKQFTNET